MILFHDELVSAPIAKDGRRRFKVRRKALVQMRSWRKRKREPGFMGQAGAYVPETVCSQNGAIIGKGVGGKGKC